MMNKLIEEIRAMSPEEQAELAYILDKARETTRQKQLPQRIEKPMLNSRDYDAFGKPLSPEEIWDRDHPLILYDYGHCETRHVYGKPETKHYWTDKEVDAYNAEQKRLWLEAKRKVFPNATLPEE